MKKKCKVCGALLDNERCNYCGTSYGSVKQTTAEDIINSKSVASNSRHGFLDSFNDGTTYPEHSQPTPMSMEIKRSNPAIIVGIVVAIAIAIGAGAWFISNFSSDSYLEQYDSSQEATLLGAWGNGRGPVFLMVFGEADSVEFLENGTVIIVQDGSRWTVNWESSAPGSFEVEGEQFTYSIDGDTLILTDSWNDDWTFERTGSIITNLIDNDDPLSVTDIVGTWIWNFDDDFIYIFNIDGTAVSGFSDLPFDFNWELGNDNTIYMHFGSFTQRWTAAVEDDTLTLAHLDGHEVWQYVKTSDSADTTITITDSPLLGTWVDGWGKIFLWVFEEADSVEFLENGTVIITQDGIHEEVRWRPGAAGTFSADGQAFTYSVRGDVLVITDSSEDDWTFERSSSEDDIKDTSDSNFSDNNLIGSWEWDANALFVYTFNADGTAVRGPSNSDASFGWEISSDNIIYMTFDSHVERWNAVIAGNVLTLSNLDNNNTWNYIKIE